ncbi:MAG: FHA domain-containing protein [Planctomycetaceae bacterium]|nr:FHA domain-containing protein [Planctomycetaceae bacterium]
MVQQSPSDVLYNLVQSQIAPEETFTDVESRVRAIAAVAGITDDVTSGVLERLRLELQPPRAEEISPHLYVDWGELPKIGFQARPEINLVCEPSWSDPKIHIAIDCQLDHDPQAPSLRPRKQEAGLWSLHAPFRLTSDGMDCLPGQYLIRVKVRFRRATLGLPRIYETKIRLNIPSNANGRERVLEIGGDGQSVVNLQGHNLASFSKVVLKGGDQGIINLQSMGDESTTAEGSAEAKPKTTFEYQLKIDHALEHRLPEVLPTDRIFRAEAITLEGPSGKQIHLLAKKRLNFGRSRENDVVLRFLPRNEENDKLTRNLSRTHFVFECVDEALIVKDKSSKGIEINYEPINEEFSIDKTSSGFSQQVDLAPSLMGGSPFSMDLQIFSAFDDSGHADEVLEWDEVCFEIMGERPSKLWQIAASNQIDAVRLSRHNCVDQEEYVAVYREAELGESDCAINLGERLRNSGNRIFYVGRAFWIQTAPSSTIRLNDQFYDRPVFVPLEPDMDIEIDGVAFKVKRFQQCF